jgi:sugar diacid utilization regulator
MHGGILVVDLQARMINAILEGQGLRGVAELAAVDAGCPIAVLLPARGLAAGSDAGLQLDSLMGLASARLRGANGPPPDSVRGMEPVMAGPETVGYVVALHRQGEAGPELALDTHEVLRVAALAVVTEIAVVEAREEVTDELRGTLLDDLRAGRVATDEIVRQASRLGCDLSHGAVAMAAEIRSSRPRHAATLVRSEHPAAIVELSGVSGNDHPRLYALLPSGPGPGGEAGALRAARSLSRRLRAHGPAAFSAACSSAAELPRVLSEAELALEVATGDERMAAQLEDGIANGTYRLLFRALAAEPDEVRRFYEGTVEPLVAHDREYRTDLAHTLEAYLANDGNMNATARALVVHRHTVAHRLGRITELTGLDPSTGEDRERLGLGLKAYRILAPTLPH